MGKHGHQWHALRCTSPGRAGAEGLSDSPVVYWG